MKIEYKIGESGLIELPVNYIAYTFPDIQRVSQAAVARLNRNGLIA